MFRSRMRCDPKTKMRNDNSTIKWWTIQHHSWISFSGHICVLPSNFNHLLFWWCSGDKMIDDIIFHKLGLILETLASVQLKWPKHPPWYSHLVWIIPRWLHAIYRQLQSLVILMMFRWQNDWWHHLSQTRLDSWNSCICPTKMAQEPTMIFTSRLNYTTVVACNLSKWVQQVWNLTDAGRQTWVADECQYWQRHLSSWCYGKTWLGKMTEVSQLRVIFWFNSHHC
jgi:hypothetical protein